MPAGKMRSGKPLVDEFLYPTTPTTTMSELLQPKGVRDFSPEEKILRDKVVKAITEQFERYGFNPLETPLLERYDVLSAKYAGGAEILKETFRLTDQGERELGLRYDLTVPFARYVAMHPNVKLPFKRYEIGRVYRDGPIKLGRYREFYQCDGDIVGANTAAADAQCIQLGRAVFHALNMETHTDINHIGLLKHMLRADGANDERLNETITILDKLKKIGEDGVTKELETAGIPTACVRRIIAIAQLATNDERVSAIREAYGDIPELTRVVQVLALAPDPKVVFDPSLSRGLSYYTGIVYESFMDESAVTSSISSGGRYDRMIGEFIGRPDDFPAVGVSFGLEPITEALKLLAHETQLTVVRVYIIPIKTPVESNALVQELRACGINADMDIMDRGISKNLDYANQLAIPYVVFVGKKELDQGVYKLKDMRSGEEKLLGKADLIGALENA
jgi:histidyl-tRNA synthetase